MQRVAVITRLLFAGAMFLGSAALLVFAFHGIPETSAAVDSSRTLKRGEGYAIATDGSNYNVVGPDGSIYYHVNGTWKQRDHSIPGGNGQYAISYGNSNWTIITPGGIVYQWIDGRFRKSPRQIFDE